MPPVIRRLWCITKSAVIRKEPNPDGEIIDRCLFGQVFYWDNKPTTNGFISVRYLKTKAPNERYTQGWVYQKALTEYKVEDYACLYFQNETGKILPTYDKHTCQQKLSTIAPGEIVMVKARVGGLALTTKGWTGWDWLTKRRYIIDQQAIDDVMMSALAQAVKDYRHIVKYLKEHRYNSIVSFVGLVNQLENICIFFLDKGNFLYCDSVPGKDRLNDLNEELGIDMEWVLRQVDKADAWRNRERDSTGRHKKSNRAAQKRRSVLPKNGNHAEKAVSKRR